MVTAPAGAPPAEEVAPAPTLRNVAQRVGRRGITDAVVPLVLFLAGNAAAGIVAAVSAVTVWSVAMLGLRMLRRQRTGPLLWIALGYVAVRGGVAAATSSTEVFFGPGIVNRALVGVAFLVSVAVGKPAVTYIANLIYPFTDIVKAHPAYRRVFRRLTLAWAALQLAGAGFETWLLMSSSPTTFVLVRAALSWPLTIGLFAFSLYYPRRVFAREPALAAYVEAAEAGLRAQRAARRAA